MPFIEHTQTESKDMSEIAPTTQHDDTPATIPAGAVALLRFNDEQINIIKTAICPAGIPDGEFALFIEQCKRSGLDPLIKQMFCVPRNKKVKGPGGAESWVTVHEAQPAEAGMLARAASFPDFRGIQAAAVYSEDSIQIDQAAGTVSHSYNPVKRTGTLVGAWAKVERVGCTPTVVWIRLSERKDDRNPMWGNKTETLIVKCARVAALRVVYPQKFGGLYIDAEIATEEREPRNVTPTTLDPAIEIAKWVAAFDVCDVAAPDYIPTYQALVAKLQREPQSIAKHADIVSAYKRMADRYAEHKARSAAVAAQDTVDVQSSPVDDVPDPVADAVDALMKRIALIANVFEANKWKAKHKAEIDALPANDKDAVIAAYVKRLDVLEAVQQMPGGAA